MSIYLVFERFFESCTVFFWRLFIFIHEIKYIWSMRAFVRSYKPTPEQAEEARAYWKKVAGWRIPLWWHRLYASFTGRWDSKYIPEILITVRLEPNASRRCDRYSLSDKNNLSLFVRGGGLRLPAEYARCSRGLISKNGKLIDFNDAVVFLANIGPCVIKRTRDSDSGRDVAVVDLKDGKDIETGLTVDRVLRSMGNDWICQERVRQHASINAIYPGCVNTLRIITFMTEHGVASAPITLRIGHGGSRVDNAHAGGMYVHVDNDGWLADVAFTNDQRRYTKHPDTGLIYKGYKIVGVAAAVEAARRCHLATGEFGLISWDVCIDSEGKPTLLEVNLFSQGCGFPQKASGMGLFGEDTEDFVRRYRKRHAD